MGMNDDRTVFKRVDMDLFSLLRYIDLGDVGLPDIQRPSTKVRDLFDSTYQVELSSLCTAGHMIEEVEVLLPADSIPFHVLDGCRVEEPD